MSRARPCPSEGCLRPSPARSNHCRAGVACGARANSWATSTDTAPKPMSRNAWLLACSRASGRLAAEGVARPKSRTESMGDTGGETTASPTVSEGTQRQSESGHQTPPSSSTLRAGSTSGSTRVREALAATGLDRALRVPCRTCCCARRSSLYKPLPPPVPASSCLAVSKSKSPRASPRASISSASCKSAAATAAATASASVSSSPPASGFPPDFLDSSRRSKKS
mmetsp:Transcript_8655/g.23782  ORF Transcript_8655/g.23782 Transcript_8655/m.23782 type:complete len:225 (+) Transcript_8655:392-1066(+)